MKRRVEQERELTVKYVAFCRTPHQVPASKAGVTSKECQWDSPARLITKEEVVKALKRHTEDAHPGQKSLRTYVDTAT